MNASDNRSRQTGTPQIRKNPRMPYVPRIRNEPTPPGKLGSKDSDRSAFCHGNKTKILFGACSTVTYF